jgi:hypothetical protein
MEHGSDRYRRCVDGDDVGGVPTLGREAVMDKTAEKITWADKFLGQLDLAGFILLAMMGLMIWLFYWAQSDDGFDFRRALKDENEKPSMLRILAVGAWAMSSWALMKDGISKDGADPAILAIYLGAWSGAPIAAKLIEAVHAKWTNRQ